MQRVTQRTVVVGIALLWLGVATQAEASAITFIGTRDFMGGAPGAAAIGRCGAPAPPNLQVIHPPGIGASNLGSFTSTESHCVNVATGNIFGGLFLFDFGGDETLFGTYVGSIALPPTLGLSVVSFAYTLTGGTGDFIGSTGSLNGLGTVDFTIPGQSSSHIALEGTVNTVPEPATVVLLGSALAGVAAARSRRKSRHV
jgi:hypothetical protein